MSLTFAPCCPQLHWKNTSCSLCVSFKHRDALSNTVSLLPSRRFLPGAGLCDGAVESAEQHDRAGSLRKAGTALASHRGSPAVKTGLEPTLRKRRNGLGARTRVTSEMRPRTMLQFPLGSFECLYTMHGNIMAYTRWINWAEITFN